MSEVVSIQDHIRREQFAALARHSGRCTCEGDKESPECPLSCWMYMGTGDMSLRAGTNLTVWNYKRKCGHDHHHDAYLTLTPWGREVR